MAARIRGCLLPPLLLLVLATAANPAGALRFDLLSGHTKCISDDIKVGAMAVSKYHVMAPDDGASSWSSSSPSQQQQLPDSHRISLRVTSPYGNSLHYAENVHSGNFAFTASEAGDYLACFWAPDHRPPATVAFEFDWRSGVSARDWSAVAKKGQVEGSRNAGTEQENKLKDGLAWFPLARHLPISGGLAVMAPEKLL
ncbi:unnamed protein product [Miscanthus lutarioriparius]|uniref:GOLD domain-containing protein n=1 Tax=Miscanthus lutarioriparius TaxID=422564 RepID=A0A811MVD0_9POAL|nr:unnamed protein product [Miscanthus lutarioriparius]